jgi:hypothetical protein
MQLDTDFRRYDGGFRAMTKNASMPMPLKILLLVLFIGMLGLVLVGLIGHEPLAFKMAVVDMILFGGILTVWRVKSKGAGHD